MKCRCSIVVLLLSMLMMLASANAHAFKMEAGSFQISDTFAAPFFTVHNFQQPFDVPPVVFILTTSQGGQAGVVRIRNVTTTQFEATIIEDSGLDGGHVAMDVHYFAIEPGVHTMTVADGPAATLRSITIEAGILNTTDIFLCTPAPICSGSFSTHSFTGPGFTTTPVVLAQVQTFENGTLPPAPSAPFLTSSIDNVSGAGFDYVIDRHEAGSGALPPGQAMQEDIGYVALDSDMLEANFNANGAAQILVELETILVPSGPLLPGGPNVGVDGWGNAPFCNDDIQFSKAYPSRLVLASKQTRLETDGGWLRVCDSTTGVSPTRVRLVVEEDVDTPGGGDTERTKAQREAAGLVVFSRDFFFDSNFVPPTPTAAFRMEADEITLTPNVPTTVTLRQFYDQAPAVFFLADSSNLDPTAVRVTNISSDPIAGTTSFTAVAAEAPGGTIADSDTTVHYVAIDKGMFDFPDGTRIEVGEVGVGAFQHFLFPSPVGESFQTVNFSSTFSAPPVVITQITGQVNPPAAVPWMTSTINTNSVTANSFQTAIELSEVDATGPFLAETIAYLAIDDGAIGNFVDNAGNTIDYEAQRSQLFGTANSGWDNICFNPAASIAFLNPPYANPIVVAAEMGHRGGHGGWHRRCNLTPTDVRIVEDEDQFNDAERAHTWEETGLIAFAQPFDVDFGFLAWYEMEEMVWNTGAAGQVVNSAGTTLDGTPADSAQTSQATPAFTSGIDSTCRYGTFDGATDGVADGVEIGNDDLGLVDQVSVSAWVRWAIDPATGNPSAVIAQNSSSASFDDFQFGLRGSASNAEFEFRVETTAGLQFASTGGNLAAADTWFHVTGVYDGSAIMIYVDDVLEGTAAHSGDLVAYDPARELMIGKAAADALNNFGAFTGLIDELRLYRRALSLDEIKLLRQFTRPCPVLLDHYAVSHVGAGGGFGITCEAEAVLITGHDAANGPIAPPAGTIMTVTAAPVDPAATWMLGGIGTGIFADLGGGVATYEFDGVETQVELLLAQPTPATVSFTIIDGGGRAIGVGEGPALEFSDLGLRFDPLVLEIAGKPTTITVQVIETNTLTGACQASVPPPSTLDFAFECSNPTTGCTGVTSGVVEDTTLAVPTTVDAFDLGAATPANNVTLSFDPVTSTATINVQYDDAGTVSLVAAGDAGTPPAAFQDANGPFDVRPFALRVDTTVTAATTRAGEDFTVTLTPVTWDPADDVDDDGIADGHEMDDQDPSDNADLSAGNADIVNFRPVGTARLGSYLHRPSGAPPPPAVMDSATMTAPDVGPFTAPTASLSTVIFDEVGVIEIDAVQQDTYLGFDGTETAKIRGLSGEVGRFIPAYFEVANEFDFDLTNGRLIDAWTCGFTYVGQEFEYATTPRLNMQPRSMLGTPLNNYVEGVADEDFFHFSSTLPSRSYGDISMPVPQVTFELTGVAAATFSDNTNFDGTFDIELNGEVFRYNKQPGNTEPPFMPQLELTIFGADGELTDADGVCYTTSASKCNTNDGDTQSDFVKSNIPNTGVYQAFGRLNIDSAAGSEVLPLALPLRLEYVSAEDGTGNPIFVAMDGSTPPFADDCTTFALATGIQVDDAAPVKPGDAILDLIVPPAAPAANSRICPPLDLDDLACVPVDPNFALGSASLDLVAPGAGNTGYLDIRSDLGTVSRDWLLYDWDGDGTFSEDPNGRASFGLFPGREEIIYIREPWD